jgi:hypothetical protein
VLANRRCALGDAVNSPRFQTVATISVVSVAVLAAAVGVQTDFAWLGVD